MNIVIKDITILIKNLAHLKSDVLKIFIFSIFMISIDIITLWFLMDVISFYIESKGEIFDIVSQYFNKKFHGSIVTLIIFLFVFLKYFISKTQLNSVVNFYTNLILNLRNLLVKNYLNESYIEHKKRNLSEVVNNTNVELINASVLMYNVILFLIEFVLILGLFIALGFIDLLSTGLFLSYVGAMYFLFSKFTKKNQENISVKRLKTKQKITTDVIDIYNGFLDWLVFNKRNYIFKDFCENSRDDSNLFRNQQRFVGLNRIYLELSGFLIIILIVNILLVNRVEVKNILVFIVLLIRIVPSFQKLLVNLQLINQNLPSLQVINREIEVFNKITEDSCHVEKSNSENLNLATSTKIRYCNIDYNVGSRNILKIDLIELYKGEITSIVGPSGVGKSTLLYCLMGNYLDCKAYAITNKIEILLNNEIYRNNVAYVAQSVFVFNGSLFENVSMFDSVNETNLSRAKACLANVGLLELVNRSMSDLNYLIEENGKNLSGGQKQRLGIARALYSQRPILMFDEFTSNLDLQTEQDILDILKEIKKEHFILIVTHRTEPLNYSDQIYRLSDRVLTKIELDDIRR